jgi:dTDP-4-dehydrorhamnose reductase
LSASSSVLAYRLENVDIVINAAAYTNVDKAESEQEEAYFANATLPKMLVRASQRVNARFIQISTDYVFRGDSSLPYSPEDTPDPISVYGKSKRDGENAALQFENTQIIRTAWLYGRYGTCFPKTIATRLRAGERLAIVGDQIGSPTNSRDLAEFIVQASTGNTSNRILHGVSLGTASWYEFGIAVANSLSMNSDLITEVNSSALQTAARRPLMSISGSTGFGLFEMPHWEKSWIRSAEEVSRPFKPEEI